MNLRMALAFPAMMLFASVSNAGGVPIEPGLWEMKSTMTMSMMPQPQVSTETECIEETEMDPEDFNMDEDNPCNTTGVVVDGNSASWGISCPAENGMVMEGQWEMTSDGDTITGSGSMTAEIMGQEMGFNMTWEGKRIGDCE